MKITNENAYTAVNKINPVSFKDFLKRIRVVRDDYFDTKVDPKDRGFILYNSLIRAGPFGESVTHVDDECVTEYQRCIAPLLAGDRTEVLRSALLFQSGVAHKFYKDLGDIVEDVSVEHAMEYGTAEYLVQVGKRMWMPAMAEDFMIYEKNGKYTLACTAKIRTTIYHIDKMTEVEVERRVEAYKAKLKLQISDEDS